MKRTSVFLMYAWTDEMHRERVLHLALRLWGEGHDVRFDRFVPDRGDAEWTVWMVQQLGKADKLVCVCTPEYSRRFGDGGASGVGWEAMTLVNGIRRNGWGERVVALAESHEDLPLILRDHGHVVASEEELLRILGQGEARTGTPAIHGGRPASQSPSWVAHWRVLLGAASTGAMIGAISTILVLVVAGVVLARMLEPEQPSPPPVTCIASDNTRSPLKGAEGTSPADSPFVVVEIRDKDQTWSTLLDALDVLASREVRWLHIESRLSAETFSSEERTRLDALHNRHPGIQLSAARWAHLPENEKPFCQDDPCTVREIDCQLPANEKVLRAGAVTDSSMWAWSCLAQSGKPRLPFVLAAARHKESLAIEAIPVEEERPCAGQPGFLAASVPASLRIVTLRWESNRLLLDRQDCAETPGCATILKGATVLVDPGAALRWPAEDTKWVFEQCEGANRVEVTVAMLHARVASAAWLYSQR